MKYHIEKNTVQETLVIPLYGRKMCSELFPQLFRDETAIRAHGPDRLRLLHPGAEIPEHGAAVRIPGAGHAAERPAWEVRGLPQKAPPKRRMVNLGCGLDDTGRSCDNGCCKLYNLDFPDVIAVRDALLPAGEREENIPCDLNDYSWFDRIDASGGAVFFAAGVFYYFLTKQFQTLVQAMAQAFPGGRLVFDARGEGGGEDDAEDVDPGR